MSSPSIGFFDDRVLNEMRVGQNRVVIYFPDPQQDEGRVWRCGSFKPDGPLQQFGSTEETEDSGGITEAPIPIDETVQPAFNLLKREVGKLKGVLNPSTDEVHFVTTESEYHSLKIPPYSAVEEDRARFQELAKRSGKVVLSEPPIRIYLIYPRKVIEKMLLLCCDDSVYDRQNRKFAPWFRYIDFYQLAQFLIELGLTDAARWESVIFPLPQPDRTLQHLLDGISNRIGFYLKKNERWLLVDSILDISKLKGEQTRKDHLLRAYEDREALQRFTNRSYFDVLDTIPPNPLFGDSDDPVVRADKPILGSERPERTHFELAARKKDEDYLQPALPKGEQWAVPELSDDEKTFARVSPVKLSLSLENMQDYSLKELMRCSKNWRDTMFVASNAILQNCHFRKDRVVGENLFRRFCDCCRIPPATLILSYAEKIGLDCSQCEFGDATTPDIFESGSREASKKLDYGCAVRVKELNVQIRRERSIQVPILMCEDKPPKETIDPYLYVPRSDPDPDERFHDFVKLHVCGCSAIRRVCLIFGPEVAQRYRLPLMLFSGYKVRLFVLRLNKVVSAGQFIRPEQYVLTEDLKFKNADATSLEGLSAAYSRLSRLLFDVVQVLKSSSETSLKSQPSVARKLGSSSMSSQSSRTRLSRDILAIFPQPISLGRRGKPKVTYTLSPLSGRHRTHVCQGTAAGMPPCVFKLCNRLECLTVDLIKERLPSASRSLRVLRSGETHTKSRDGVPHYLVKMEKLSPVEDLDLKSFVRLARDCCRELDALHAIGFLHLDLKPSNLLRAASPSDEFLLADFGLSKKVDEVAEGVGSMFGTRGFIPSEQLYGDPLSEETDYYGFGMTLLHLLGVPQGWLKTEEPGAKEEFKRFALESVSPRGVPEYAVDGMGQVLDGIWMICRSFSAEKTADRKTGFGMIKSASQQLMYSLGLRDDQGGSAGGDRDRPTGGRGRDGGGGGGGGRGGGGRGDTPTRDATSSSGGARSKSAGLVENLSSLSMSLKVLHSLKQYRFFEWWDRREVETAPSEFRDRLLLLCDLIFENSELAFQVACSLSHLEKGTFSSSTLYRLLLENGQLMEELDLATVQYLVKMWTSQGFGEIPAMLSVIRHCGAISKIASSHSIVIKNLSPVEESEVSLRLDEIARVVLSFGAIETMYLIASGDDGCSVYIRFRNNGDAAWVVQRMQGWTYDGNELIVEFVRDSVYFAKKPRSHEFA